MFQTVPIKSVQAIKLDPSCYQGYERKHAALHGAKRYEKAVEAFDVMLSKLKESGVDISSELVFRHHPDRRMLTSIIEYVDVRPTIRNIVQRTVRHIPRVLIDISTGRLGDKQQQASAFEKLPIYFELVSSMTTQLDGARIESAVEECYRYVMLSHRWDPDEPLHQKVKNTSIYDLHPSPANTKLRTFCLLVRSLGFRWAWTDNSCVDRLCNVVLQESLVAMFTWYRGSSLTVVYLRGVLSESQRPGDLSRSIWNTRAWTYQEYVAAETVRFYTEDWKPYLGLDLFNHKESPVVISEMQQVTGVSAEEIAILCPGRDRVREKLYLASRREATFVEDIAYSLFGIFDVARPIMYGEGHQAVGRLLENLLTGSGDVTILAWTGRAGSYNSCLPTDLSVYDPLVPPHVPRPIEKAEMDRIILTLQPSRADLSLAKTLLKRLHDLPSPQLGAKRLRLPGIACPLARPTHAAESRPVGHRVYRATTPMFGAVEIKTADDLTEKEGLWLVHPWIRPLRDQEFSDGAGALDETTQALRFVARLRQPFGALLFEQLSSVEYRRVAADSLIIVQIREDVSLTELIRCIRTIEVL